MPLPTAYAQNTKTWNYYSLCLSAAVFSGATQSRNILFPVASWNMLHVIMYSVATADTMNYIKK